MLVIPASYLSSQMFTGCFFKSNPFHEPKLHACWQNSHGPGWLSWYTDHQWRSFKNWYLMQSLMRHVWHQFIPVQYGDDSWVVLCLFFGLKAKPPWPMSPQYPLPTIANHRKTGTLGALWDADILRVSRKSQDTAGTSWCRKTAIREAKKSMKHGKSPFAAFRSLFRCPFYCT